MQHGSLPFKKEMTKWLYSVMASLELRHKSTLNLVEFAAGLGRNFHVLSQFASEIHAVEMIEEFTKGWPAKINGASVTKHVCSIQDFS